MSTTTKNGSPAEPHTPAVDFRAALEADVASAGGPVAADPEAGGSIGKTMFDRPGSTDLGVTVLLHRDQLQQAPAQALVRVRSRADGRTYLGVVTAGPFAEPDGLRADSSLMVTLGIHSSGFVPEYHGRVEVSILGEELADGTLTPPRLRPLPNSPVFVLGEAESAKVLKCEGDIRLGLAAGHAAVPVGIPSAAKAVLPRHTAILGTTGGGKSTTVAGLVQQAREAGWAVVLLDVEGEYTRLNEPTTDPAMVEALKKVGRKPDGLKEMTVYHLVGRQTSNPDHPSRKEFSLQFARLSPYAVMEILDLSEAQQERFLKAYDVAKELLRDLGIFPAKGNPAQEQMALELDEFERGYPRLTLPFLLDVVGACLSRADRSGTKKEKEDDEPVEPPAPRHPALAPEAARKVLAKRVHAAQPPGNAISWRALLGRLSRLNRLKVFYGEQPDGVKPLNYPELLRPGRVSVIDLSDTGFSELNNLVIADLLRGLQDGQDKACEEAEKAARAGKAAPPTKVLCVIEEAHEFLSEERIRSMPVLFREVAKIAKRGRKRWLGLAFVTQLPQHLPKQLFGLVNSFVLHKITDPAVVSDLKKAVAGIDDGLWARLPGLAPGQAIASFPHFTRPLLVSVDPAPGQLRMTE